jgi:toxin ParE1/3/4
MDKRVRFHPAFNVEVLEAAAWYDQRSPDLGDTFTKKVREAVDSILRNPDTFLPTERDLHYRRVGRFPFIVLFESWTDEILFFGVIHTSRSLENWQKAAAMNDRQLKFGSQRCPIPRHYRSVM